MFRYVLSCLLLSMVLLSFGVDCGHQVDLGPGGHGRVGNGLLTGQSDLDDEL